MSLAGGGLVAAITQHLADRGVTVLVHEELADEGATIVEEGDAPAVVEHARSALRALWIVDVPSRAAAIELAASAPTGTPDGTIDGTIDGTTEGTIEDTIDSTIEVREAYTAEDFGAPPEPQPPSAPPPPARHPDTQRFIAFIRSHAEEVNSFPTPESRRRMDAYCAPLAASGTMIGGQGLKVSARGARVRRSAAQRFVLDGPFAESKELVGGYMIVQVPQLVDAIDLVRPWLTIHREGQRVRMSAIEVRRLVER